MNKKQILKEQKRLKEERRQTQQLFNDDKEVYNVFKIGLGVILFIGACFLIINIFNGNLNIFNKSNRQPTEINPSMLIVGTMFNKEEGDYLVLAYDMSDDANAYYSLLAANYYVDSPKLYSLDLSSGFNKAFVGNEMVITNDLNNLQFNGPALLLINKDTIKQSYLTEVDITNYFNSR